MISRTIKLSMVLSLTALAVALAFSGCGRGRPSEHPPIHFNPNMDNQEKYKAQAESRFFQDGAAMRTPMPGTVAQGRLKEDVIFFTGRNYKDEFVEDLPVDVTLQLLRWGRERYDIYCAPCHSRVGDGRGIMVNRGYLPPPSFHQDYIRDMRNGYYYDVISNGVRNMPAYAHQIGVEDRWAIVAYLRALQRSRTASERDVPEALRGAIRQAGQ